MRARRNFSFHLSQRSTQVIASAVLSAMACFLFMLAPGTIQGQTKKKPSAAASKSKEAPEEIGEKGAKGAKAKKKVIDGVGTYTSKNFLVYTDLPAEQANDLLKRLETMLSLISKYWGRPPSGIVEMYVVKDLKKWPMGVLSPGGLYSIETGAGVTESTTVSSGITFLAKATVYAVADRETPQHEAVHAYCAQAFGRTGPVWYSEGMAEMGKYWRVDDSSVNADPIVIEYLQQAEVKSLNEIVNGEEWTGDSWQNYAWRWALCHLLANNPNYAQRFRPLGLGLLTNQDVSFEQTYGDMAKEISFEYRQFIKHLEKGFRVDLCGFDWKAKFKAVKTNTVTTAKIDAPRGWQASRLTVSKGEEYEYSVSGSWTLAKNGTPLTADGDDKGEGKLVGVLLKDENGDYALGDEFELGTFGTFTAPEDGDLHLRCRDKWVSLADNKGSVQVKLKMKGKGNPLPPPKDDEKKKPAGKEKSE